MGARVFHVDFDSTDATATYLHLPSILEILYSQLGIQRLTVEGGVAILESFIISGLFDKVLIIISPSFGAGYALFQKRRVELARLPKLVDVRYEVLGRNLIMMAEPEIIFEAPQL